MNVIEKLAEQGQSIWLDYIRRSFLVSGGLRKLVDQGVRGVTSNPSIFDKAIRQSSDYDSDLEALAAMDMSVMEIYEALAVEDIGAAADQLMEVYEKTGGRDGFVSLEVSPDLAHDAPATIGEAKRLFQAVGRPNVMIKVPATPAGVLAIPELIGSGVNVNVTLLFGVENYEAVALAYIEGLKILAENGPTVSGGHGVDRVASVASFFVSRVDSALDPVLAEKGADDLMGKLAVANCKAAYARFLEIFSGPGWDALAKQGARVQRMLWASTSTKNPDYPDTLYVDTLVGPDTVNTLPTNTLEAVLDHGEARPTVAVDMDGALDMLDRARSLGIDLAAVTGRLQDEGVAAFAESFRSLLASVGQKRETLLGVQGGLDLGIGDFYPAVEETLDRMEQDGVISRVWEKDHTVWQEDPTEVKNRLGWLFSPFDMPDQAGEISALVREVKAAGFKKALLLGMGGSSLAPEVFRETYGVAPGCLDLKVLDSTDPDAVLAAAAWADPAATLFVVSTKSGGTVETLSFCKYFYRHAVRALGPEEAGAHFCAITDPGSGLEDLAKANGFRKIFLNDPDIGGRYSALSFFGMAPAGLVGADVARLLENGRIVAENAKAGPKENLSAQLGAALAVLAESGRDKLTLVMSPGLQAFGAWLEQLVAESTGKLGKGVLPVDGEPLAGPEAYGPDRVFVYLRVLGHKEYDRPVAELKDAGFPVITLTLPTLYSMAGQMFLWEMATALCGKKMGINPFDQPNVESAKKRARAMLEAYEKEGSLPSREPTATQGELSVYADFDASSPAEALERFLSQAPQGGENGKGRGYVAVQAYVTPGPAVSEALKNFQAALMKKTGLAVTVGYGPRFLHSTGQLHKGDAGNGLFIQLTAENKDNAEIPENMGTDTGSISFGVLKKAQALGDAKALTEAGRKLIRFDLGQNTPGGIAALT